MPLNQALLGKEYPPVRYEVGREKLREFAESVGETDPVYHDEEAAHAAGHPAIPAVPTFPIVLTRRVGQKVYEDPDLGLDYSRVVHGEQEFTYHRPIFAGDRLLAAGRVAAVQVRGRHELLAIETRVTTERADLVRYAGASGDFNPIHWNDEWARSVGLPGVIAHGMFSMGVAARMISAFAGNPAAIKRLRVRFSAMIQPGQTLTVSGEVAGIDGDLVRIRFWGEDENGNRVVSKGEAELELA